MSDKESEVTEPSAKRIPTVRFKPLRSWLINPHPESGSQGVEVHFDQEGRVGVIVRGTNMSFCLSRDAALILGVLIKAEIAAPPTTLSTWITETGPGEWYLACGEAGGEGESEAADKE